MALEVFMKKTNHKIAFTLAEVLITLGIIGVVAAMTLPTVVANYQKKAYVTQLKRSISLWEQVFKKMMADDGVDSLKDTTVFNKINGTLCDNNSSSSVCDDFYKELGKYVKIINIAKANEVNYTYKWLKKGSTPIWPDRATSNVIFLSDNTLIQAYKFRKAPESPQPIPCDVVTQNGGKMCEVMGNLSIDINGLKGPNVNGRDVFTFNISGNGLLIPYYSSSQSIYVYGDTRNNWIAKPQGCGHKGVADAETVSQYGSGCAARVIDNGWVMDY